MALGQPLTNTQQSTDTVDRNADGKPDNLLEVLQHAFGFPIEQDEMEKARNAPRKMKSGGRVRGCGVAVRGLTKGRIV